jgi:sec-independent protein translocase protein TatC
MLEEIRPHIAELRSRLIKVAAAFFIVFIVAFTQWKEIFLIIAKPAIDALSTSIQKEMIFTNLVEPFITAVKVSLYTAFFVTLPFMLYQIWKFIAPGLYDNEKELVFPFVFFGTLMFFSGAAFAYFVVFPVGFKVLIHFGGKDFVAMLKISEYISVALKAMVGFGIAFELPVVTFFLAKIGLVTDKDLKDFSRYAIVIIFILAAVLTPPDLFSQFAMALPLLFLYAISIFIAKAINPYKADN